MLTLMVGNPDETDEDVKETLDLIFEMERKGLLDSWFPSVFTPLEGTRMQDEKGVARTADLTTLQWQLIMKCWKMNLRPGLHSWWGPTAFRFGGLLLWASRAASHERSQLYVADALFLRRLTRQTDVPVGQTARRKALEGEDSSRAVGLHPTQLLEVSAGGHRRHTSGDSGTSNGCPSGPTRSSCRLTGEKSPLLTALRGLSVHAAKKVSHPEPIRS